MTLMKKLFEKPQHGSSGKSQTQQKGAQPSGRSITPGTSLSGVTKVQHREWTQDQKHHHALTEIAAQASSQARDMLQDMMQPKDREGPNEMQEILDALAMVLRNQREMKEQISELQRSLKQLSNTRA
jgi:succinate dehydrogenase/fumarate reductase flavoprotein subunit